MKKLISIYFLLIMQFGIAQYNDMVPWAKGVDKHNPNAIQQLEANYIEYFKSHDMLAKGSGMKQYERWKFVWEPLFNHKTFNPISSIDNAFRLKTEMARNTLDNSNWVSVGPTLVNRHGSSADKGRVNFGLIDPTNNQIMYVGTPAGGIWKTTNGGTDWTPLTDHLPQIGVSAIALSHSNHNIIFIGTGDDDGNVTYSRGVYKSTDGGTTWNPIGPVFAGETEVINEIIVNPSNDNIILVASSEGLYRTTNGGTTWQQSIDDNIKEMRMHPTNANIIYAVSTNIFYKSTDGGNTFNSVNGAVPPNTMRLVLDVTPAAPNKVYVATAERNGNSDRNGNFRGLYISNNSGTSFSRTNEYDNIFGNRNQTSYDFAIAVSDTDPNTILIGNIDIWRSTDGGNNFSQLNDWNTVNNQYTHADIHFLRYYNGQLIAGTDGGVYVSNNNGNLFTGHNTNLAISQFYRISISNNPNYQIYGGLQDNGGYARKNLNWHVWHGADGMDTAIDGQDSNIGYSFIYFGYDLNITTNGGEFANRNVSKPSGERGNWVTPLNINSQNTVYAGYKKLYKLQYNYWQAVTSRAFTNSISTFTIDSNNDNHIIVGVNNELYRSTDGGVSFTHIKSTSNNIRSIAINSTENKIWIATTDNVFESSNNGTTWTNITGNLPGESLNVIKYHKYSPNNSLYLGTHLGVYYKDDNSANWQVFSQALPNTVVTDLEINNTQGLLVAATHGRGVWETPIPIYLPAKDAAIEAINIDNNNTIECSTTPNISIRIYNRGNNIINHLNINYSIDGTTQNMTWNGNLASNNYVDVNLPNRTFTTGNHNVEANIVLTGDQNNSNNHSIKRFIINQEKTLPYSNNFETPSTDQLVHNNGTNNGIWTLAAPSGNSLNNTGSGTKAYCTNSIGNYIDNATEYLYSPCYNFTNFINPKISFKLAYDIEVNWDAFYVEYSTNFGTTWQVLGTHYDANWYNNSSIQGICQGDQWSGTNTTISTYSHDLSFLTNEPNVIFRFVLASDPHQTGEGVVLDDLQITGTMSIDEANLERSVMLYPNPTDNYANLKWDDELQVKAINIYSSLGNIVYQKNIETNTNQLQINTSHLAKGIYFVKLQVNNSDVIKKLIVK